jgi:beta-glucosidase
LKPTKLVSDSSSNGVESVKAGMDLEMPFPAARGGQLLKALSDGTLSESDLDPLCQRVVKFLQTVKPLDPAQRQVDRPSPISPKDVAANRQIAGDGIILLKNDGILPLDASDKSKTVAVIGPLATDKVLTHLICPSYIVNPLEGITSALAQHARKPVHVHGPYSHKDVPVLDGRFTPSITFHKWNIGDRTADAKSPVSTDTYHHAIEALLMRPIPGLDPEYEIEMVSSVTPDVTGSYVLSLRATWDAEVYINGTRVYSYHPGGPVDIQKFLFHSHGIAQTFTYTFDANKTYDIRVVVQSQPQAGSEPMAQGLLFGLILDRTEEDLLAEAIAAAQAADEVILCVGTTSEWEMEGVDRADIQLPKSQARLAREIIKANPRTVVVNQSGSAVDIGPAMDAAAIVHAHFSGQECGNGKSLCSISSRDLTLV